MKKIIWLFLLLVINVSVFAIEDGVYEKKPFPKYMYKGEELNLEKYFNLKDVMGISLEFKIDENIYPTLPSETEITTEEELAYNDKVKTINEAFRILKIKNNSLVAQKVGNAEVTLVFNFENEQRTDVRKTFNISVVDYDQKEWQNLSNRFNIKKIITKRVTWTLIFIVLILLIVWAVYARQKKIEKIRAKRKKQREDRI